MAGREERGQVDSYFATKPRNHEESTKKTRLLDAVFAASAPPPCSRCHRTSLLIPSCSTVTLKFISNPTGSFEARR